MKYCVLCLAAVVVPSTLNAQDSRPKFEVASIKECKDIDRPPPSINSPGRLSLSCWPLKRLIQDAYQVFADGKVDPLNPFYPFTPIEDLPEWVNAARYSIDAKSESPQTPAMMRGPMMQALLEARFQLGIRRETRELPVFFLTVSRGGPKLTPSKDDSCVHLDPSDLTQPEPAPGTTICAWSGRIKRGLSEGTEIFGVTLAVFARLLHADRPVIDRTGLSGAFDITLLEPPDQPKPPSMEGAVDAPRPSLAELLRTQLGLQLEPGKGPREFFIVDHIQRPSGN